MSYRIPKTALVDTCFWFALFEPADQYAKEAKAEAPQLDSFRRILVPWPVLYETLSTRNTRSTNRRALLNRFELFLKSSKIDLLDDAPYRSEALNATWRRDREFSLVDNILRLIIEDVDVKVDCIFTFNAGDFADVCRKHKVEMILQNQPKYFHKKRP
jgi:predicted nucleic acid-binding protein